MSLDKNNLSQIVEEKEARKLKAQRNGMRSVWFGLGMFGLIGWSIVVPVLLGAMLGQWLDKEYPEKFSWTLTLLFIGLIVGCLNAWRWIDKEDKSIQK